ncbi:thioesterase family protein [Siccirubricoccus sp. G192]|uniref:acyl-CoA thioesterase n=1 Tax=Siccirubricoccus sp. G192 TaxID=2849651 RepID=UPI001C2BA2EC|nr:thioesterase family protein [Siccirubricoccus sp. G192]MBV1798657.1 thioesterase family protein [Siccirubricoccus sp. G192]
MRDDAGQAPPLAIVRPDWVDHYGHMNMAFYLAVFDMATDQLWPELGLGPAFRAQGLGTFAAETWVNYVREVREGMPLNCTNEVLGFDGKRLLALHRMHHATEGWLAAENEVLYLCVDLEARKVAAWPQAILDRFAALATGNPPRRLALRRRE